MLEESDPDKPLVNKKKLIQGAQASRTLCQDVEQSIFYHFNKIKCLEVVVFFKNLHLDPDLCQSNNHQM